VLAALLSALPSSSAPPGRERAVGTVTATTRVAYRVIQADREIGTEACERRLYDNTTVVYEAVDSISLAQGVGMVTRATLTLEEESSFPRSLRLEKRIHQPDGSFSHTIDLGVFANVVTVQSRLRGVDGSRRAVVPAGTPVQEIGAVFYWHQILFWYDRAAGGRQRYQWLDPSSMKLDTGEIYLAGDETLTVLGKKTPVEVFKVEREKLGPATLYVDAAGTIVRCDQTMSTYELTEYSHP
jgi:hypothetical protein